MMVSMMMNTMMKMIMIIIMMMMDDDDDDDVPSERVKLLLELLKKHNVYFRKFIISRK